MYGLEAISVSNGWAMAVAGVLIVFAGLVVLSLTISQFYKLLDFWEDRNAFYNRLKNSQPINNLANKTVADLAVPPELAESVSQFKLITNRIGEPFPLPRILDMAQLSGLYNPHSTLNDLIKFGLIIPDNKGYFLWAKR